MALPVRTIDGRTWRTPLTDVPLRTVRTARLKKSHYRGTYHNEGIGGFEFWRTGTWLPVIALQQKAGRRWKTWMVDDPVHWDGLHAAAISPSVERHRVDRLRIEDLKKPILFVGSLEGQVLLVDGRHRYTRYFELRATQIPALLVTQEFANQFLVDMPPLDPVELLRNPSGL